MAIQNRRGAYTDFDPSKLLPGEYAIVLSGDPSDDNGYAVYICLASGTVKRLVFSDQLEDGLELKQDELTFDSTPTANSPNPVTSGGIKTALDQKQGVLTFDNTPTPNSGNPVRSSGIKTALDQKQGVLTFDTRPTMDSANPVTSSGIAIALALKQNRLTFDAAPTYGSQNPVRSYGIYNALAGKQNTLTFDNVPTANSSNPVKSGGVKTALDGKQNTLTFDSAPTASSTNPVTSGGIKTALDGAVQTLSAQIEAIEEEIAGLPVSLMALEYDGTQEYRHNAICFYNDKLYQCILPFTDYTTGTFDSSAWQEITLSDPITYLLKFKSNSIADEYSNQLIYMPGMLCTHNGGMYRCTQRIADEDWNSDHWESVSLRTLLADATPTYTDPNSDGNIVIS